MKMLNRLFVVLIILAGITAFQWIEGDPFLEKLKKQLQSYTSGYPEEKIYIQTDKPIYAPGETIWFNTFVLMADKPVPSALSDVVYVELIDAKGNVAATAHLVLTEGTANGDFQLSEQAPGGRYRMRAYTRWMKNFGEENVFTKEVIIQHIITPRLLLKLDFEKESYGPGEQVTALITATNLKQEACAHASLEYTLQLAGHRVATHNMSAQPDGTARVTFMLPDSLSSTDGLLNVVVRSQGVTESIARAIPIVLNKLSVTFFPEGGQYTTNVRCRVAFKVLNEFDKGADITGTVVDEHDNPVAQVESLHMGMGSFQLTPAPGAQYFLKINKPVAGVRIPLPAPHAETIVMNLAERTDNTLHWMIYSPVAADVYLVARAQGELLYSQQLSLVPGVNTLAVATDKFPCGLAVFTLFDKAGNAHAERLVFLHGEKGLRINLTTDKKAYAPRERVTVNIQTTDYGGNPVAAKLSLAVVDDKLISFADDKQDNLLSSMLLSSEVTGEIQEPSFYFDPAEPQAHAALDNLLMTQGWRRYTWKDVADNMRVIQYAPEKVKNLAGTVVNDAGVGLSTEVTLLEVGGRKRIVKVKTTPDGHFIFKNTDPKVPMLLLTRKPGVLVLQNNPAFALPLSQQGNTNTLLLPDGIHEPGAPTAVTEPVEPSLEEGGMDITLSSDATQLSEVVVTALGVESVSNMTGSVVRLSEPRTDGLLSNPSIESALQGRVAGVVIQPQTGNPGSQTHLVLRGVSSLGSGRNEPLYVIDGHPIGTSLSHNFSNTSMVGPDDIESIEVINSPEMTALYGSQGANGVIQITTKSKLWYPTYETRKKKPARYASQLISPRLYTQTREFYVPPPLKDSDGERQNFQTTLYWNYSVVTNEHGNGNVSFYTNDAVTAYRITAEGFSNTGLLGRKEDVFHTELPLSMDVKIPDYLGYEDVLKLPVTIRNESDNVKTGRIQLDVPAALALTGSATQDFQVSPHSATTLLYTLQPKGVSGTFPVRIDLESGPYTDRIRQHIAIRPVGFPVRFSYSAKEADKTFVLPFGDIEKNSLRASLTAYPDILHDLFNGAESILREPHGCFEQVSASTFPNILALRYLQAAGLANKQVEATARQYIRDGYRQLMAYEIRGGGFEWFGHPPAHEGLTAYGLLEFNEMKKVYPYVDETMLNRTRQWLLDRRTGKGGFKQGTGKYGFSGASEAVTNAYIVYALSETGTTDIVQEYEASLQEARQRGDMYRMALVALSAHNLKRIDEYENLVSRFREHVQQHGYVHFPADHSLVRSYGNSLHIEAISLWALALMKSSSPDLRLVQGCIKEILQNRSYGQFGSTQGTTLALQALAAYAQLIRTAKEDGSLIVHVDGKVVERKDYSKGDQEAIVLQQFGNELQAPQEHQLRVHFEETNDPLPYTVDLEWYSTLPQSSEACPVSLTTVLDASTMRINETMRLTVTLRNKQPKGLPMTVAIIGIPAGLSVQPWQLKELMDKGVLDFYEIINGNLVVYYRELAPTANHVINLDLKAEIPGTYTATASSAYLYYTPEHKAWTKGNTIRIE